MTDLVGERAAWDIAAATPDPELPMVTVADLGILREVRFDDGRVIATITPTYSGCPAMSEIGADVRRRLRRSGYDDVEVRTRIAPPWTSDWITGEGRRKLAEAGIAPPATTDGGCGIAIARALSALSAPAVPRPAVPRRAVPCPLCGSADTERTAQFGSTACKALYRCRACREPFEHLKEI